MRARLSLHSLMAVSLAIPFLLVGCSKKSSSPTAPAPAVQFSADSLDFGGVAASATKDLTVNVTNPGTTAQALTASIATAGYSIVSGGGSFSLAGGASHPIVVRFAPTAGGHQPGSLSLGAGAPSLKLVGDGTTVSFQTECRPTLTQKNCVGCHSNFSTGAAALVGLPAPGYGTALIIKPYDPANSVLYAKIANLTTYGNAMPPGSLGVSALEKSKWSTWILEGAHDN